MTKDQLIQALAHLPGDAEITTIGLHTSWERTILNVRGTSLIVDEPQERDMEEDMDERAAMEEELALMKILM